ncbi:MAG: ROK family protein [candidate division Zixibacteria bacterium]|nr:ROK family protein [candidate division Zixibacteria bacterium]
MVLERAALGIDIGGTSIKFGIVSPEGRLIRHHSLITKSNRDDIIATIKSGAREFLGSKHIDEYNIEHIGMGSPGAVNVESGVMFGVSANIPGWSGTNLKEIVREFGLPTHVDNDANAALCGELSVGAGRNYEHVIYVTIGTGVGGGIAIDNKVHHGANYSASEIGHTIIHRNGRKCGCGKRGCMEQYASVTGMMKTAKAILMKKQTGALWKLCDGQIEDLKPEDVTREFVNGDPAAVEIIERQASALAEGIAPAISLLNPELLIIGGAITDAGQEYFKALTDKIGKSAYPESHEKMRVVKAKLGGKAGVVGAAFLRWV